MQSKRIIAKPNKAGYSLVELLVSILLMALTIASLFGFLISSMRISNTSGVISKELLENLSNLELETPDASESLTVTFSGEDTTVEGRLIKVGYGLSGSTKYLVQFVRNE